LVVILVIKV